MTIKNVRETGQKRTKIVRITILEQDGTETVVNASESVHFIFGFAQADRDKPSNENPMEVMMTGDIEVLGEMFYQIGNANPELVHYCFRRDAEAVAEKIVKKMKESGTDPLDEVLKKMPVAGGGRAN